MLLLFSRFISMFSVFNLLGNMLEIIDKCVLVLECGWKLYVYNYLLFRVEIKSFSYWFS